MLLVEESFIVIWNLVQDIWHHTQIIFLAKHYAIEKVVASSCYGFESHLKDDIGISVTNISQVFFINF